MYENELTQAFCVPCFVPMVQLGETHARTWECPACGPHAIARRVQAARIAATVGHGDGAVRAA